MKKSGYTVKDIQEYLQLSCPQPIYRWFKGMMLPTVDHLYALSILFGIHMEELIVPKKQRDICAITVDVKHEIEKRIILYYKKTILLLKKGTSKKCFLADEAK
ncbi:MAG: helix-turn-helix transcriptional regulator [Tyzzerella sp.]|nr:helix-turn-helix transcriptional regulator [Tyzzerella sp.]